MPLWLVPLTVLLVVLAGFAMLRALRGGRPDIVSESAPALARKYLEEKRYMEAMVVAKKGIEARPRACECRLLLAEVYAAQGKQDQAIAELRALLEISPAHEGALELAKKLGWRRPTGSPAPRASWPPTGLR